MKLHCLGGITSFILAGILYTGCLIPAEAQNPQCPTRPYGDDTNACASTAFVQDAINGGGQVIISGCDGTTDNSTQIQAGLNTSSVTIIAPGQTCRADNLSVPANKTLTIGAGATLKKYSSSGNKLITAGGDNVTINGAGTIDGNNVATFASEPIFCDTKSGLTVEGLTIKNSAAYGVHMEDCSGAKVRNNTTSSITNTHILANFTSSISDVEVSGNYCTIGTGANTGCVTAIAPASPSTATGTNIQLKNNTCVAATTAHANSGCTTLFTGSGRTAGTFIKPIITGNTSTGIGFGVSTTGLQDGIIANNVAKSFLSIGIEYLQSSNLVVDGNAVDGAGVGSYGFSGQNNLNLTITGNQIRRTVANGILESSSSGKSVISNNVIVPESGIGISTDMSTGSIVGNVLVGDSVDTTTAIDLSGGGSRVIVNNIISGWTSSNIGGYTTTDQYCLNSALGCRVGGSNNGYDNELNFAPTGGTSNAITTIGAGAQVISFDHLGTGNTGSWSWKNGTNAGTTRMSLSSGGALSLGTAGSFTGTFSLSGATSGTATITPQAAAGTPTLTLPNASGTFAVSATSPLALSATTGALTCTGCLTNTPSALTKVDDTNVTLTLGGTPSTALLQATSITAGWSGQLGVSRGGTGIASGTSGGIPYFSGSTSIASSGVLGANQIVLGGGAATTPATLGSLGTATTVLHGNASGAPTWGAVSLTADVTGTLPVANGGTGLTGGAWTSFTPSPSCGTATFTVNSASAENIGKTVNWQLDVTISTIGTCASPAFSITLPYTPAAGGGAAGAESDVTGASIICRVDSGTTTSTCGVANGASNLQVNFRMKVSGVYQRT